jgi:Domain of unknown function (DUF3536)
LRSLQNGAWSGVRGARIDPRQPYRCGLPSGAQISVFFYDGPISRAVAFEGLLNNGETFAGRLAGGFEAGRAGPQLVHIATDGESYGHHHQFGEMALTAALRVIEERNLARITNYGEYLALRPPDHEVAIVEPTSWSCAHGIERWRSNCGCNSGGHPDWSQQWRGPLREALDWLRDTLIPLFEREGSRYLIDPWKARDAYIDVVLSRSPDVADAFFAAHGRPWLDDGERVQATKLLEMQRHAMLMFTSCGWFFDEISGIETVQVLRYAARALQLSQEFGEPLEAEFVGRLAAAKSNIRQWKDGAGVYRGLVRRSAVTLPRLIAHYGISSLFEEYDDETQLYAYTVHRTDARRESSGGGALAVGLATAASRVTGETADAAYAVLHLGGTDVQCGVRAGATLEWYEAMKGDLTGAFLDQGNSATVRALDGRFDRSLFGLPDLFIEERRKVLDLLSEERLGRFEGVYRELYQETRPLLAFMRDSDVPVPPAFLMVAEYTLTRGLTHELRRAVSEPVSDRAFEIASELVAFDLASHWTDGEVILRRALEAHAEGLLVDPVGPDLMQVHRLLDLADTLGIVPNLWQVQNAYHDAAQLHADTLREHNGEGDEAIKTFWALGERLSFNIDRLRAVTVGSG